jgi:hypothetical protein
MDIAIRYNYQIMLQDLATADFLNILQVGTIEVSGLLPWSSNYTFLLQICHEAAPGQPMLVQAVYKPQRGERPLWDFPQGTLCQRERAAFLVSEALGWGLVPPTVLRDGPHGLGSVQLFIDHDPEQHYFSFEGSRPLQPQLQRMALLDLIINNADRKSGHVLLQEAEHEETTGRLWGIDHGICFHTDYKLRTVIWEFIDMPIPADMLEAMRQMQQQMNDNVSLLGQQLGQQLATCLSAREIAALSTRLGRLLETAVFPNPGPGRHYPWPPV